MFFSQKDDVPSIEAFIQFHKSLWKGKWKSHIHYSFTKDARTWWQSLDHDKMMGIFDEAFEKFLLEKWSHAKSKYKERTKGLFSCGNSIL